MDRRPQPKIGIGRAPVRAHQHAQSPVLQGMEGIFVGVVIAEVSDRSLNIHLRQYSVHRIGLAAIGHANLNPAIKALQRQACALANGHPTAHHFGADFVCLLLRKATPMHGQAAGLVLQQIVQLQAVDPPIGLVQRLERTVIDVATS